MTQVIFDKDKYISCLPDSIGVDGWKTVKGLVSTKLDEFNSIDYESAEDIYKLFSALFWQDIFDELIKNENTRLKSFSTRLRYKALVIRVGEIWTTYGLLVDESYREVKNPPKHNRRQVVNPERLVDKKSGTIFRLQDFQFLLNQFVNQFNGMEDPGKLISNCELEETFVLACLLTGFLQDDPLKMIHSLTWNDIFKTGGSLSWIPYMDKVTSARKGGYWIELAPFNRLIALCIKYRNRKSNSDNQHKVVKELENLKKLRRKIIDRVVDISKQCNLPEVRVDNIVQTERLHLRLNLKTNLLLSILTGMVKENSISSKQVEEIYEHMKNKEFDPEAIIEFSAHNYEDNSGEDIDQDESKTIEIFENYSTIYDELRPFLFSLVQVNSESSKKKLNDWVKININSDNISNHNFSWMIKWLIENKKSLPTKQTYWLAALRILQIFPFVKIENIGQEELKFFLESDYLPASLLLSKAAWKQCYLFMKENGVELQEIDWKKLRVIQKSISVRVFTKKVYQQLITELPAHLGWSIRLSYWAGLRVGEVCRLRACDLSLEGLPFLYVVNSKGKKSRRVSLEHLSDQQLKALVKLKKQRADKSGNDAILIVDLEEKQLVSKNISNNVSEQLEKITGKVSDGSRRIHFHSLRSAAAERFYVIKNDIRYSSIQLGHRLVRTDVQHYQHTLDLQASIEIQDWNNPLYKKDLHLPIVVIASFLGYTSNQLRNYLDDFDMAFPASKIQRKVAEKLPDGERPGRGGAKMQFINVVDANRLIEWMVWRKDK
ncbi:MAG: hypothetical protein CVU43_01720 [Chloroflexi bacterium HGW-Chloroflexi-5]|nr:MAG: hypothetical protein CVU43_01720 [Chloroflexi bacterium HGW-Chloroflexi-5]